MGTKIKCLNCGDIIEGDKKGNMIWCTCGKTAIDQTPDYCRINAQDFGQIMVEENGVFKEFKLNNKPQREGKVYIFLDIDGVLNNEQYTLERCEKYNIALSLHYVPFDPDNLQNLYLLCSKLKDVGYTYEIILSSSWRLGEIPTEIVNVRLSEYGLQIKDKTPNLFGERGIEIEKYLSEHNDYVDMIILDDEDFDIKDKYPKNIIKTDYKYGFNKDSLERALKYFNL